MFSTICHPSDTGICHCRLKCRRNSSPQGRRTPESQITLRPRTIPRPSSLRISVLLLPGLGTEQRRICRSRHFPSSPQGTRMNFKISCQVSIVQMLNSWQGPRMCSLRYKEKLSRAQALAEHISEALYPHSGLAQRSMQATPSTAATPGSNAERILAIYGISILLRFAFQRCTLAN